nr:unnamed protein product [Spirometra erinaceieuropaei]
MHFQSRVSATSIHEVVLAHDCALNATSKGDMQRSMDLFATACDDFGLIINMEESAVMHQNHPTLPTSHPKSTTRTTSAGVPFQLCLAPRLTINTDRTPEPTLPSYTASTSAAAAHVPTITMYNPDIPTNININAVSTNDLDSVRTFPNCDRTLTSYIGLADHLRIHRTETGKPVSEAPYCTHRICLHCPHRLSTFTHRMGLLEHMCIHESGIHHSV